MKNLFYKILLSFFIFLNIISFVYAGDKEEAVEYIVTMNKVELCEDGSTTANCLNPITISPSGKSLNVDIAGVNAGVAAGNFGSLGLAVIGKTYTFVQITMNRLFTLKGTVAGCSTDENATAGGVNAYATGKVGGSPTAMTVAVPNTVAGSSTGMGATLGDHITGVAADGTVNSSGSGNISKTETQMQFRKILNGALTLRAGSIPSLEIAFGTDLALESQKGFVAGLTACTHAIFNVAEPDISITPK